MRYSQDDRHIRWRHHVTLRSPQKLNNLLYCIWFGRKTTFGSEMLFASKEQWTYHYVVRNHQLKLSGQTRSTKVISKFFRVERSLSDHFRKIFLSTIMNGQFHVDPENLSPWVIWGQNVIWSENNPSHMSSTRVELGHDLPYGYCTFYKCFVFAFCQLLAERLNTEKDRNGDELKLSDQLENGRIYLRLCFCLKISSIT